MTQIIYFAYGSNMLTRRLLARCPSIQPIGTACLNGHDVGFIKRSIDGSGKAGLIPCSQSITHGVAFSINRSDLDALDQIEGPGYYRASDLVVEIPHPKSSDRYRSGSVRAVTYLPKKVEHGLRPYDWYLGLILAGCREHALPQPHISRLSNVKTQTDPNPDRPTAKEASALLHTIGA